MPKHLHGVQAAGTDNPLEVAPVESLGRVLARNTSSNFVGQIMAMALLFYSVPYFTRTLGTGRYGAFVLLMTYVETFSLLNLGLNAALVKYLAELLPQKRIDEAR